MSQLDLFKYDQIKQTDREFIQNKTVEIKALVKRSAQDIIDIGSMLIEVKERLPHGMFGPWLDAEFRWGNNTAQRMMNVARRFKNVTVTDLNLPPKVLYLLASPSTPDEAREEAVDRASNGETITHLMAKGMVQVYKEIEKENNSSPQIPTPLEMADWRAEKDEGYTEDEWNKKPDSYLGNCFKECYTPRIMTKGEVLEYGVRGVYVCSGCGYAYSPMLEPDEITLEKTPAILSQPMKLLLSHQTIEYYTPSLYIEAAKEVMGTIDLDPASCEAAQVDVKANKFYTISDDGLSQEWHGCVWLNPPYSKTGGKSNQEVWSTKLADEYMAGNVTEAVLLVKSALGYKWFENLWDMWPVCFVRKRISFTKNDGTNEGQSKHGTALFYLGKNTEKFKEVFRKFGRIILSENDRYSLQ